MLDQRMKAASVRAVDALKSVTRCANKLCEEMDEVTSPHGIPLMDLDEEDSVVIAVKTMIDSRPRLAAKGG